MIGKFERRQKAEGRGRKGLVRIQDRLVGDSDSPLIVERACPHLHQIEDCDGGLKPKGSDGNRATQPTCGHTNVLCPKG